MTGGGSARPLAALFSLPWCLAAGIGVAAPPVLDALMPAGGQAGTEVAVVTAIGKVEPWPCPVWCSHAGVTFQPGGKAGQYRVSIAAEAAPGPCLVRLHNPEGASEPRVFVVSRLRELVEDPAVDNDRPSGAVVAGDLPVAINGALEKAQDFDAWKVSLKKGQVLRARLDGYSLRSGIDPFLGLYDASGARMALASDGPRNLDPWLSRVADRDGEYVLGVMAIDHPPSSNISFTGSAKAVYRLTLTVGPPDSQVTGEGGAAATGADTVPPAGNAPVALPLSGYGTLAKPGEADRVRFRGTKGMSLLLKADAVEPGFPTDPVLALENPDGTVIREVDDAKSSRDAESVFKVPADGELVCRVEDRYHRGGPEIRYRLEISEMKPDFTVSSDSQAYRGKPGDTVPVKLKMTRIAGHAEPVTASVTGLPAGATATPLKLDAKGVEGVLEVKLDPGAAPFSGPIRVAVAEEAGEKRQRPAAFSFQSADARGPYLIDEIGDLWLTILPKEAKTEEKKDEKKP